MDRTEARGKPEIIDQTKPWLVVVTRNGSWANHLMAFFGSSEIQVTVGANIRTVKSLLEQGSPEAIVADVAYARVLRRVLGPEAYIIGIVYDSSPTSFTADFKRGVNDLIVRAITPAALGELKRTVEARILKVAPEKVGH